jgi:hypothetical protein
MWNHSQSRAGVVSTEPTPEAGATPKTHPRRDESTESRLAFALYESREDWLTMGADYELRYDRLVKAILGSGVVAAVSVPGTNNNEDDTRHAVKVVEHLAREPWTYDETRQALMKAKAMILGLPPFDLPSGTNNNQEDDK